MSIALDERTDAREPRAPRKKRFARKPRRPRKIPSNGFRRINSSHAPRSVEIFMTVALLRVAKKFAARMLPMVMGRIEEFAKPKAEDAENTDADANARWRIDGGPNDGAAATLIKGMKSAAKGTTGGIDGAAEKAGGRVLASSKADFKRLGIDIKKEPSMNEAINGFRKECVARITNMQEEQLGKIEGILKDGFGHRAETIAKSIERQLVGVTESRAKLIARDQVLSLHAKITHHRQKAAGINSYIWTTSGDERVREEHEELEGEVFSWDDGGDDEEGHPGDAVNCRCTAYPVVDDDDEDEG